MDTAGYILLLETEPGMTIQKALRIGIRSGSMLITAYVYIDYCGAYYLEAGCKSVAVLDDSSVRSDKPQLPFPAPQAPSAEPGGQDPSKSKF